MLLGLKNFTSHFASNRQRVVLRVDLNTVPIPHAGESFFKLEALMPTLEHLREHNAHIILLTHLGRPAPDASADERKKLSTKPLVEHFKKKGFTAAFAQTLDEAAHKSEQIVVLENLRFFEGEKEGSAPFAKKLAALGDYYVNDAFGLIHRADASVALAPTYFEKGKRFAGFLMEKELAALEKLFHPKQPFILVVGGDKGKTKLPLLASIVQKDAAVRPSAIVFGGVVALVMLKAMGLALALKDDDADLIKRATELVSLAQSHNVKLIVPKDVLVQNVLGTVPTSKPIGRLALGDVVVDIGQSTIDAFSHKMEDARTIFCNGPMGLFQNEHCAQGTQSVFKAMAHSKAYTIIGGGETVAALTQKHLENKFSYVSTGGGALLTALACKELSEVLALPALKVLSD